MTKAIEDHKISVTIATVSICAVFVFGVAFNLGAEQNKIKEDVEHLKSKQSKCEKQSEKQANINEQLKESLIIIKSDLKHIKESLDELKE